MSSPCKAKKKTKLFLIWNLIQKKTCILSWGRNKAKAFFEAKLCSEQCVLDAETSN